MRDASLMFRVLILVVLVFLVKGPHAIAQAQPEHSPRTHQKVAAALNSRLDLDFAETPLVDVIDFLQEQIGVTIVLRNKKLEEAGVLADVPVSANYRQIRLETWLNLALDELDLTWMEQDDLIVVTTREDAEMHLVTHVYDCRDLLAIPKLAHIVSEPIAESEPNAESIPTGDAQKNGSTEKTPLNKAAIGCGSYDPRPLRPADPAEHLMEIVSRAVDIHTWDAVGGPGTIGEYRGLLVVTQTDRVHKKVAHLLDMLREAAGLEVPQTGKVVR